MILSAIDVAVLAGGMGTRLRGVLQDIPKILAPVAGQPFLEHVLVWLSRQGARRVVLCLGYRAEAVQVYLGGRDCGVLEIETVVEPRPLGTGGAIAFARHHFHSDPVLVMNGDTIIDADLNAFLAAHCQSTAEASILCAEVPNAGRYGRIEMDGNQRIARFVEKDATATGAAWINGGVYLFGGSVLERIGKLSIGSLERDVLEKMPGGQIYAYRAGSRFLDIGTPETLAIAPEVLSSL
jgi:NDP-sugar pyrophosphorylase family protein